LREGQKQAVRIRGEYGFSNPKQQCWYPKRDWGVGQKMKWEKPLQDSDMGANRVGVGTKKREEGLVGPEIRTAAVESGWGRKLCGNRGDTCSGGGDGRNVGATNSQLFGGLVRKWRSSSENKELVERGGRLEKKKKKTKNQPE